MAKRSKILIMVVCLGFFTLMAAVGVRINDDGLLSRYFFPKETFMIVEGEEQPELSLNIVLDGKRRNLKSFPSLDEENVYYFFLPAGSRGEHIRVLNDFGHKRWRSVTEDFSCVQTMIENGHNEICFPIEDALTGEIQEISIRFIEAEHQASVFVDAGASLEELLADRELETEGELCIYDDRSELIYEGTLDFKGHGSGSWSIDHAKKSWRLGFNEPTSILGMKEGYKYIAISNSRDDSHMRNKIVYDWAEKMNMPYSPQGEFVNFYINGEYQGLYFLSEGIEVSDHRVAVRQDGSQPARTQNPDLKQYMTGEEKGYLLPERIRENEEVGYLLREEPNDMGLDAIDCGFLTQDGSEFEILYPKKVSEKQVQNIRQYVQEFHDAVMTEGDSYLDYIDLDSFVKKYLIEQMCKNRDGNRRSSYYSMIAYGTENRLYQGPVWDYDFTFGNFGDSSWLEPKGIVKLKPGLDQHPEFMQCVIQYYDQNFRPYLENEAENRIRETADEIRTSVSMDQTRWGRPDNFYDSVEAVISFLQVRKQFLDDVWLNGKTFYRVNFVDGDQMVKTIYVEEGKSIYDELGEEYELTREDGDGMFDGWYDETLEYEMDCSAPVTDDMALWAKWK